MTSPQPPFVLHLETEAQTIRLGEDLALALCAGSCVALSGDLGAGKSTLARALIRAIADDPELDVPSPTFTLVQNYDLRTPVAHFDLYRLSDVGELHELGFDEALSNGICLVEWPEMAHGQLGRDVIDIRFEHRGDGRQVTIRSLSEPAMAKIGRTLAIRAFLQAHCHGDKQRRYLSGDASARAYELIPGQNGSSLVLMDWPRKPDGPAVLDGKPYPKVAHIAEDAYPFVALSGVLQENGFTAPGIVAADCSLGIVLMEDLGRDGIIDDSGLPIADRYRQSVACLAFLHSLALPRDIPVGIDHIHHVPDFDAVAMSMEVRLLIDWYLPFKRGTRPSDEEYGEYTRIWQSLIDTVSTAERNLLLRDFHSPNILWQPQETGHRRIGIIDFQDAMIGPTSYDVASLVQDARVTIGPELKDLLLSDYLDSRRAQGGFDEASFLQSFAIMAAQRNCKLAGIWVRLMKRDGKAAYMQHMPRTLAYLQSALDHAALEPLRDWCFKAGVFDEP